MGHASTIAWLDAIAAALDVHPELASSAVTPFVIPAFPLIPAALERLTSLGVVVGAQTVSWGEGALTGEVSATLLAEMGVGIVEIGHAERRRSHLARPSGHRCQGESIARPWPYSIALYWRASTVIGERCG